MLSIISNVSGAIGAIASLAAAILWLWASRVEIPPFPDVGWDSDSKVFDPIRDAFAKSARLNAWAARASCLAAGSAVAIFLCGTLAQ